MKMGKRLLSIILSCIFLLSAVGCAAGEQEKSKASNSYTDIVVEVGERIDTSNGEATQMGLQYYKECPVQLLLQRVKTEEGIKANVLVKKADGTQETLIQNTPWVGDYGCIGEDGCFYTWDSKNFKKITPSEEIVFDVSLEELKLEIRDFCQLDTGEIYVLAYDTSVDMLTNGTQLATVNASTGEITQVKTISRSDIGSISKGGIAASKDGLMIMVEEGIYLFDATNGGKKAILSFTGSTYKMGQETTVKDYRMLEEGKIEFLRIDGTVAVIERKDVSVERMPITIRGMYVTKNTIGNWLKDRIAEFNEKNKEYFVVLEECDKETDPDDYAKLTTVEISTGKGPDIIMGPILEDYICAMIEKGAFEDFTPYMQRYGIDANAYFPGAFNAWQDGEKIYGVNFYIQPVNYYMSEDVLGNRAVPDVEAVLDALLAWQEKAVFMEGYDSVDVVEYFLEGTDSLWGMVDWEKGTCDFKGELFKKLLEVAKRYGDDAANGYDAVAERRACNTYFGYEGEAWMAENRVVPCGVLFDEGCYGALYTNWTLAVNANSGVKEGAWEFITFLLSEEAQTKLGKNDLIPAYKAAFLAQARLAEPNAEVYVNKVRVEKVTESEITEMMEVFEGTRPYPLRTVPLLDIICEEVGSYFDGSKSAEEVIAVIENRVRLYLDEQG